MRSRIVLVCALLLLAGCGVQVRERPQSDLTTNMPVTEAAAKGELAGSERKVIYTAAIDLAVKDFEATDKRITSLVDDVGGYIASYREEHQGGHWVVRLPAAGFQRFTEQVLKLGVVVSRQSDAQDVTEQVIDLNARLHNKQRMEQRVLKLIEERPGQIKDVLEYESQLARIREEIEALEGKVRYLADRVAMTTVTITARQDPSYFPAAPPVPPTFVTKALDTLFASLTAMRELAETVALAFIAAIPWLFVGTLLLGPVLWLVVRFTRRPIVAT